MSEMGVGVAGAAGGAHRGFKGGIDHRCEGKDNSEGTDYQEYQQQQDVLSTIEIDVGSKW